MTSLINNQPVYIERLLTPQVTDIGTTPSITPLVGSLAYSTSDPTSIYVGDGTNWNKVSSSGSTGGTINGATLTNCNIDNSFIRTNDKISTSTQIGCPTFADPGHTFNSTATVTRNINIPNASGSMILDTATQNLSNKTIIGLVSTGTSDSMLSNKVQRFYFSGTSINATPITLTTFNTSINSAYNYRITMQAFVSAGTHVGGSANRVNVSLISNVSGTASVIGTTSISSLNTSSLNGISIVPVAGGTNTIIIRYTGVSGDTINFSGYIELNS